MNIRDIQEHLTLTFTETALYLFKMLKEYNSIWHLKISICKTGKDPFKEMDFS